MKKIVILGATSAIAHEAARQWAKEGHSMCLIGRDEVVLGANAADLKTRGAAGVFILNSDLSDRTQDHDDLIKKAHLALGGIDYVLMAYGVLGDQNRAFQDLSYATSLMETNFLSVVRWLLTLRHYFLMGESFGSIGVITSVAGDRGRASNYLYGSAKGGLSILLSGLSCELEAYGIKILNLKPGFVDTPMTSKFTKGFLWTQPQRVGQDICHAFAKGKRDVYLPWFWRYIMLVIKHLPHAIFKKLKA